MRFSEVRPAQSPIAITSSFHDERHRVDDGSLPEDLSERFFELLLDELELREPLLRDPVPDFELELLLPDARFDAPDLDDFVAPPLRSLASSFLWVVVRTFSNACSLFASSSTSSFRKGSILA